MGAHIEEDSANHEIYTFLVNYYWATITIYFLCATEWIFSKLVVWPFDRGNVYTISGGRFSICVFFYVLFNHHGSSWLVIFMWSSVVEFSFCMSVCVCVWVVGWHHQPWHDHTKLPINKADCASWRRHTWILCVFLSSLQFFSSLKFVFSFSLIHSFCCFFYSFFISCIAEFVFHAIFTHRFCVSITQPHIPCCRMADGTRATAACTPHRPHNGIQIEYEHSEQALSCRCSERQ